MTRHLPWGAGSRGVVDEGQRSDSSMAQTEGRAVRLMWELNIRY